MNYLERYSDYKHLAPALYNAIVVDEQRGVIANTANRVDMEVKAFERDGKKLFRFKITTGGLDRANDRVDPSGLSIENFLKNPLVLWNHASWDSPIGRCVGLQRVADGYLAETELHQITDVAKEIYALVENGFLKATSIGFIPLSWEDAKLKEGEEAYPTYRRTADGVPIVRTYTKAELLEYSICPIPMNPSAVAQSFSVNDDSFIYAAVEKGIIPADGAIPRMYSQKTVVSSHTTSTMNIEEIIKNLAQASGKSLSECDAAVKQLLAQEKAGRKISAANAAHVKTIAESVDSSATTLAKAQEAVKALQDAIADGNITDAEADDIADAASAASEKQLSSMISRIVDEKLAKTNAQHTQGAPAQQPNEPTQTVKLSKLLKGF